MPAGNPEKMQFAVAYGADAVYLGLPMASLRTSSKGEQFTPKNLARHIKDCQNKKIKVYVTLNIFAGNRDLDRIIPHLEELADISPDALIISDSGIFRLARHYASHIPIHVSTQANVLNYSSCAFWQDAGAERIILAREVPLREIAEIKSKLTDLELECFVHGSLCVAYSGRCMISDYLTDNTRSSNKGMCGNSCRWEFEVTEKTRPEDIYTIKEDDKGSYLLNSKDLCLVKHLDKLRDAGICSFKVEGRTKGIHYVATVAKVYREAIDYFHVNKKASPEIISIWEEELMNTSNRGFTEGFLFGRPNGKAYHYQSSQTFSNSTFVAIATGEVNKAGLCKIKGKNRFLIEDDMTWITPHGVTDFKITEIMDEHGFRLKVVHPNQEVWINHPFDCLDEMLRWSLIRRKETVPVAC